MQRAVDAAVSDRAFLKALDDQAPPPNRRARDTAIATALALADWDIPLPQSVEPSAIGGLALWYQKGTDYVLVECDNDGDITLFFHDERDGEGTVLVGHAGATLISVTLAVRRLLRI